jgi:hypothetical protein
MRQNLGRSDSHARRLAFLSTNPFPKYDSLNFIFKKIAINHEEAVGKEHGMETQCKRANENSRQR